LVAIGIAEDGRRSILGTSCALSKPALDQRLGT
jgi:transposase-like protein